jgi:hypothetical protein
MDKKSRTAFKSTFIVALVLFMAINRVIAEIMLACMELIQAS